MVITLINLASYFVYQWEINLDMSIITQFDYLILSATLLSPNNGIIVLINVTVFIVLINVFIFISISEINLDMSITSKLTGPVRSSSNHTITCSTTLLSARLQWYKMMGSAKTYIAVPQDKLVKVKNDKQNKLVLQLSRVTLSDAGVYKCVMKYHGKKKTLLTALNVGE